MNRYFLAGYYVEHEDMGYEIEIYKENGDRFHPHELEYEVNRELVDLLNREFKECVCVKVYIKHDEPVIPDELIPRQIRFKLRDNLLQVFYLNLERINNMRDMFEGCVNFLGFNWWPAAGEPFAVTGEVTDTSSMFANCRSIEFIDMSRLETKYVERMEYMFRDCVSLKGLLISENDDDISSIVYEWDTSNVKSMYGMFEGCESAEMLPVDILNMFSVENTDYMFKNCTSLRNIKFNDHKELVSKEYYPYQRLVTTNEMFYNCESLVELEIPYFDMSRVNACEHEYAGGGKEFITEMRDMFYNCHSLNTITLENFEIYPYQAYENELTFKTFFELLRSGAPNLKSIQITRLNSRLYNPNVTDMSSLFENLTELTEVDLNGWYTKNITDMSHIFHGCVKLERINIDGWDLSKVRYANSMFEDCNSVSYIMLEDKPFKKIASANRMFKNCQALNSIEFNDQSMFEFLVVANEMFYGCTELKNLTIPNFDVRRIGAEKLNSTSIITDMDNIFYDCGNLETLKLDKFKIDNATSVDTDVPIKTSAGDYRFEYFFDALRNGAPNIKTIEMRNFNNYDNPHYNSPSMTSMKNMFKDFTKVETIDLSDCNTWGITDMSYMFANCNTLTSLDLSSFHTNDVTTMEGMFRQTSSLKQLNISSFDFGQTLSLKYFLYSSGIEVLSMNNFNSTGNVTDMSFMFCHCGNLRSLENMENLNTENVKNMSSMFWGCSKIEELQLSNFNTDEATNMSYMFRQCKMLSDLDLSAFNTRNVKAYQSMFEGCELIQKLDLSHFRGAFDMNDKCFGSMFKDCKNLEILDIGGFTGRMKSSKDAEYMFSGCEKLRYIDMSNFRYAMGNLNNGVSVFANVGVNTSDGVLNVGMLYIDDPNICRNYAEKINSEVSKNVKRINIYVQEANADECMFGFEDIYDRIRFIEYTNKVIRIDLPMSIPGKSDLRWDANLREYYIKGEPAGIHEKIKIPTFPTTMHLDFNPWCERDDNGNIMGEKDVEYVKVQIPMKEKIEEESDK